MSRTRRHWLFYVHKHAHHRDIQRQSSESQQTLSRTVEVWLGAEIGEKSPVATEMPIS